VAAGELIGGQTGPGEGCNAEHEEEDAERQRYKLGRTPRRPQDAVLCDIYFIPSEHLHALLSISDCRPAHRVAIARANAPTCGKE
jgi:hypothetical protein